MRIESRNGKLVADIIVKTPTGKVRERANVPGEIRSASGAKRWAEARALHLAQKGKEPEAPPMPTLREFSATWLDACRANKLKPATLDAYDTRLRLHVLPAVGSVRLNEVGDLAAQRLKEAMAGKDAKTVNDALATVSAMLNLAVDRGILTFAKKLKRVQVAGREDEIRFYDFDEWERLVDGAENAGPMVLAMVLLAGEAGLRRGELVALEQVDVGPQEVTVRWNEWQKNANERHTGSTKGNRIRRVQMTERLRGAIASVRHLRGKRLLWQPSGRRVSLTTIQSWLELACRRAGLPESRDIHRLRHTFCSHLAMRGATAKAIQELAGHADIKTTMRYMHLSPAHKAEAIRLLEMRDRGAGVEQDSKRTHK